MEEARDSFIEATKGIASEIGVEQGCVGCKTIFEGAGIGMEAGFIKEGLQE